MAASKEKKSAIVSGAGFAAAFWIAFEAAVREAGGSDEDLHRLGTEEGAETLRKMASVAALRGKCEIVKVIEHELELWEETFPITVDYGQTLSQMIEVGGYDWVKNDITAEHFHISGEGRVDVELRLVYLNCEQESATLGILAKFGLYRPWTYSSVLADLDADGFRPAKVEELLALVAKYPNLQRDFQGHHVRRNKILALGSIWEAEEGMRYVVGLKPPGHGRRTLDTNLIIMHSGHEFGWYVSTMFLAASK